MQLCDILKKYVRVKIDNSFLFSVRFKRSRDYYFISSSIDFQFAQTMDPHNPLLADSRIHLEKEDEWKA